MDKEAWKTLGEYRRRLTRQEVRTLAGQIKAGHSDAAMNGLAKILDRQDGAYGQTAQRNKPNRV